MGDETTLHFRRSRIGDDLAAIGSFRRDQWAVWTLPELAALLAALRSVVWGERRKGDAMRPTIAAVAAVVVSWVLAGAAQASDGICLVLPDWPRC